MANDKSLAIMAIMFTITMIAVPLASFTMIAVPLASFTMLVFAATTTATMMMECFQFAFRHITNL